jgi:hypothetical protein
MRDRAGRLDAAARHADIQQHDVGQLVLDDADCVVGASSFRHDLQHLGAANGVCDPFTKQRMVVNHRNANTVCHVSPATY